MRTRRTNGSGESVLGTGSFNGGQQGPRPAGATHNPNTLSSITIPATANATAYVFADRI